MRELEQKFKKGFVSESFGEFYLEKHDEMEFPEELWEKCIKCGDIYYAEDSIFNYYICSKCGHHFRIDKEKRKSLVVDEGSFVQWGAEIRGDNPLDFKNYEEKLSQLREKYQIDEAVEVGRATIDGIDVVVGICDSRFMMGSMGYVVGERIASAFERAVVERLPVILICCSGGARMQEGIISLMQMAKISATIKRHSEAGLLYIAVLTDPTTGGVTASFAMLGDIILAEPSALIGFAGPRVIEQTIGHKLPLGFQRSEFLLEHGMIDCIVERKNLRKMLSDLLKKHAQVALSFKTYRTGIVESIDIDEGVHTPASVWDRVMTARMVERPTSLDYINHIFDKFIEMHGDRLYADDQSVIGGIAYFDKQPVTVIGIQKGKNVAENIKRNFGMPSPDGYRKALRLMKQAEKFHRPIIIFVDTPGAFCGIDAEARGQGRAIANNLFELSAIRTPILSIIIGEGGSGGALALAVGNEVWMMENATYSILSPEGFASILWKDICRAKEAAEVMRITAQDLKELDVIEKIIEEPGPANENNIEFIAHTMKNEMVDFLRYFSKFTEESIVEHRYRRFRKF